MHLKNLLHKLEYQFGNYFLNIPSLFSLHFQNKLSSLHHAVISRYYITELLKRFSLSPMITYDIKGISKKIKSSLYGTNNIDIDKVVYIGLR